MKSRHFCELSYDIYDRVEVNLNNGMKYTSFMKENPLIAKRKKIHLFRSYSWHWQTTFTFFHIIQPESEKTNPKNEKHKMFYDYSNESIDNFIKSTQQRLVVY